MTAPDPTATPAAGAALPGRLAGLRLSTEMRRFAAGIRAVMAMLATAILLAGETSAVASDPRSAALLAVLLVYDLWSGWLLWAEARGRPAGRLLVQHWIDVTWTGLLVQFSGPGHDVLIFTAVQPVLLASIGAGVRNGVVLALYAALWVAVDVDPGRGLVFSGSGLVLAAAVLTLVPVAALLARPVGVLRQRIVLVRELEERLDPRRGVLLTASALVDTLRQRLDLALAGLVLPASADGPALLTTADDAPFQASPQTHRQLETLLSTLPARAVLHRRRASALSPGGTQWIGPEAGPHDAALTTALDDLCSLLDQRELLVLPFLRYEQRHGHLLLGSPQGLSGRQDLDAVIDATPDILRILEQATLVDRLVRETAAHERVRIGRDLHDSAIQPYLGLKFALDALTVRVGADNPVRPELVSLGHLVEGEIASLREIVSGLRDGEPGGDNALVPAVRRQVRQFAELFGIAVELEAPKELRTTRALAGAVFHMVNEALNNVRRHTPARHVKVVLEPRDGWLRLSVTDDGAVVHGRPAAHFTPRSLDERARELGGTLTVSRPDGLNTEVLISIPLDATVRQ